MSLQTLNDSKISEYSPKGAIFTKLDWYTAMFNNCSILEIFKIFHIEPCVDLMEVFARHYENSRGYSMDYVFDFGGIRIYADSDSVLSTFCTDDLDMIEDPISVFNTAFRAIRVDISGGGLDTLRAYGYDVDKIFSTPLELPEGKSYHLTRADFAFDLVDYMPTFLDENIKLCREFAQESGRVLVQNSATMKYSIRVGDQKTLYLGSPRSDAMLRIYDKKLQFEQANKFQSQCPYRVAGTGALPQSWIRIELQTRKSKVMPLLYDYDMLQRFQYIYDHYGIRPAVKEPVSDVWRDLFDWATISDVIIQNANPLTAYKTIIEKADRFVKNGAYSSIVTLIACFGWNAFRNMIDTQFERLQRSQLPVNQYRWKSLMCRMFQAFDYLNPSKPEYLVKTQYGTLALGE